MISLRKLMRVQFTFCFWAKHGGMRHMKCWHHLVLGRWWLLPPCRVVLSSKLYREVCAISFHPYFSRVCSLHFTLANINIRAISCYFPTAWNTNEAVGGEHMNCWTFCWKVILCSWWGHTFVRGWFQCLYWKVSCDANDIDVIGFCGDRRRNSRGITLVHSVLKHNVSYNSSIGWPQLATLQTRCHANVRWVESEFNWISHWLICSSSLRKTWNVFMIAFGFDHRCVHAAVQVAVRQPKVISYRCRRSNHSRPCMNATIWPKVKPIDSIKAKHEPNMAQHRPFQT